MAAAMSIELISQALNESTADGVTKLILIGLCNHANSDGLCWPSVSRLATYGNCSERTVQRCLAKCCAMHGLGHYIYAGEDLPEGVELKDATMDQIRAANDAYLADVTNLASVVPATKAVGTAGRTAMRVGRMANDAIGADAIGLARAVAQGDLEGVGEVFQRSGEGGSVGAAKVGSDYFNPPRENAGRAKDLALFSPFSLNTKQKTAPYNWKTGANDLGILSGTTLIRPEDDLGKTYYFGQNDVWK